METHLAWLTVYLACFMFASEAQGEDICSALLAWVAGMGRCFIELTEQLAEAAQGRLFAIDGKTLRRSFDQAHRQLPIHMVHAWDQANGLMLGQLAVEAKSNEITAVPALLELLDVQSAVVSLDAMHCQKDTAQAIRAAGADYLLALKGNQKTLHEDVKLFFDDALEQGEPLLEHVMDPKEVGAARLGELIRGHWSIENAQHWQLDVSFGDDTSRVRKDHGPANLAAIKRHVLGLVKRSTPKASTKLKAKRTSLKTRRFLCSLDDDYLVRTLTSGNEG